MNVQEKFESILVSMGMFDSQAKEVMKIAKVEINDTIENYYITFHTPSSDYPDVIYNILMAEIKPIALKWIKGNCPMAWFKPMFQ